jgi:superfamily II DNA or RNA helicase/ribonuclease BN (tRNA processing enzyme)
MLSRSLCELEEYERWNSIFEEVKDFVEINKRLPSSGAPIGNWCAQQKRNLREGKLSQERIAKLESIPCWSLRERNNQSSRQSYEKKKLLEHSRDYEYVMIEKHRTDYADSLQAIYHWNIVPENFLWESGYINDINQNRLRRLLKHKSTPDSEKPLLRDVGFDAMSLEIIDGIPTYCGLQAKMYSKNNKVTGDCLGTFYAKMRSLEKKNPLSKGYLYSTSSLQVDIQENFKPFDTESNLEFKPLLWEPPDKRTLPTKSLEIPETSLTLRDYQEKIINECMEYNGIQFIHIPCGLGKTLITCHILKRKDISKIYAIAPLKISVENLRRIHSFFPEYSILLVDSDTEGTTDIEFIKDFIRTHDKYIILSTFESTGEILSKIITDFEDSCLVCDEVHNVLNNECLISFIKQFRDADADALLLSATIPEELLECFNDDTYEEHTYTIKEAIDNGYITDYQIWLPHLIRKDEIDIHIPEELIHFTEGSLETIYAKGLYIINGMIQTGSRRCIAYLSSQEECNTFMEICRNICYEYHGISLWIDKIDSTIGASDRKRILTEFQSGDDSVYHILTSVRILDEAIDIPRCDSEFIGSVGEHSSDIRFTQRGFRGSRLDRHNPTKKNHIFVWASGNESCLGIFEILRTEDPEFHKKVSHRTQEYTQNYVKTIQEVLEKETSVFQKWYSIHCITLEERWNSTLEELKNFVEIHKRLPTRKEPNGIWCDTQKQNHRKGILSDERISKLESIPGWRWAEDPETIWNSTLEEVKKFVEEKGRLPTKREPNGIWCHRQKQNHRKGILSQERISKLESIPGWKWAEVKEGTPETIWNSTLEEVEKFIEEKGRLPTQREPNGRWCDSQKQNHRKGKLSEDRISKLESIPGWKWAEVKEGTPETIWNSTFKEVEKFVEEKGRLPTQREPNGMWCLNQRQNHRKGKLSEERISKLESIPGWKWAEVKEGTPETIWNSTFKEVEKFVEEKGRLPTQREPNGMWCLNQRQNHRKGTLSDERISKLESIPGWKWATPKVLTNIRIP